jgi:hypothetical protein
VWARTKEQSKCCKRFAENPNKAAEETDVVVVTSVVGAGFSISRHY